MRTRLACAAILIAAASLSTTTTAVAQGAWPPNPPPVKVKPHIACWRMGDFCWIPVVW